MENKKDVLILGIESSCDETCASIVKNGREIISNEIISSAKEHLKFGGVVPEIASRVHLTAVYEVVERALKSANLTIDEIDAVAVTYGAGLVGALLVGVSFAKSLAYAYNKPLIPVNHIRGHISACYLVDKELEPPFLAVISSGGHTAILYVKNYLEFEVLGATLDDAIGEAFDKVARMLGLEYPGGVNIERIAIDGKNNIDLPKMLKGEKGYNLSYSGLKTAVGNYINKKAQKGEEIVKEDVACSFQTVAVDELTKRAVLCAEKLKMKKVCICGGVAANEYYRESFKEKLAKKGITLVMPPKNLCTDNGAMIASEGYVQYLYANRVAGLDLNATASIPLK